MDVNVLKGAEWIRSLTKFDPKESLLCFATRVADLVESNSDIRCQFENYFQHGLALGGDPERLLLSFVESCATEASWAHWGFPKYELTSTAAAVFQSMDPPPDTVMPFPTIKVSFQPGTFVLDGLGIEFVIVHRTRLNDGAESTTWIDAVGASDGTASRTYRIVLDSVYTSEAERALEHTVRNALAYVSRVPEDVVWVNQQHTRTTNLRTKHMVVGRALRIDDDFARLIRQCRGRRESLWKLAGLKFIRGHWRWQPIGHRLNGCEGPANARSTLIAPFTQGPEELRALHERVRILSPK